MIPTVARRDAPNGPNEDVIEASVALFGPKAHERRRPRAFLPTKALQVPCARRDGGSDVVEHSMAKSSVDVWSACPGAQSRLSAAGGALPAGARGKNRRHRAGGATETKHARVQKRP
jgi:hypothetical protein